MRKSLDQPRRELAVLAVALVFAMSPWFSTAAVLPSLRSAYAVGTAKFDPSRLRGLLSNRDFGFASLGYFGHMWELYAMWAWIAAFYAEVFVSPRAASLSAFAVIGAGALGSAYGGLMSDRLTRNEAAALAMRWSASVAPRPPKKARARARASICESLLLVVMPVRQMAWVDRIGPRDGRNGKVG